MDTGRDVARRGPGPVVMAAAAPVPDRKAHRTAPPAPGRMGAARGMPCHPARHRARLPRPLPRTAASCLCGVRRGRVSRWRGHAAASTHRDGPCPRAATSAPRADQGGALPLPGPRPTKGLRPLETSIWCRTASVARMLVGPFRASAHARAPLRATAKIPRSRGPLALGGVAWRGSAPPTFVLTGPRPCMRGAPMLMPCGCACCC
jgi:hypothetical protein